MTTSAPHRGRATGYSIVLAPGWRRIPVRDDADQHIDAILGEMSAAVAGAAATARFITYRAELEHRLREAVRRAREQDCVDLYLPVVSRQGTPVPASFVVSDRRLVPEIPDVTSRLAARDDAIRPVILDGTEGLRIERVVRPADGDEVEFASRRVDYLLPVPGGYDRWLVVAFTTFGAGDPADGVARLLADLFDAMMSNFRWEWETA